jgi:hypothetical protein
MGSFYGGKYCQKITTGNTEKILYFMRLTEFLLPPLCVLSLVIPLYPYLSLIHYQANKKEWNGKK